MVQKYSVSQLGRDFKLSPNFVLAEFQCKDGSDEVLIDSNLIAALEVIRKVVQKPIIINSAYRTPTHNAKIGGKPHSKHVLGQAADIVVQGFTPAKLLEIAKQVSLIGGCGLYQTFLHLDVRDRKPDGSIAYWEG